MRTSDTTAAVTQALLACDLHDPGKRRRADGAPSRHNYANLGDFLADVREELHANGLILLQSVDHARTVTAPWTLVAKGTLLAQGVGPVAPIVTRVLHVSGEWVETDTPCTIIHDPQDQGSALTYARRYAIFATLGITAVDAKQADAKAKAQRDDDDGQRVRDSRAATPAAEGARKAAHHPSWESARAGFCATLSGVTYDEVAAWCEAHGRPRPSHQTPEQRGKLAAYLASDEGRVRVTEWAAQQVTP